MRVAMFGQQTRGHHTLRALLDSGHEVVTAVAHPKSDHVYEKIWDGSVAADCFRTVGGHLTARP